MKIIHDSRSDQDGRQDVADFAFIDRPVAPGFRIARAAGALRPSRCQEAEAPRPRQVAAREGFSEAGPAHSPKTGTGPGRGLRGQRPVRGAHDAAGAHGVLTIYLCFLVHCLPEGQDVPQDAVVGPAEDELDRRRRREALARAASRDEASQAQDLFVISAAVLLPVSRGADGVNQGLDLDEGVAVAQSRIHILSFPKFHLSRPFVGDGIQ